MRPRQIPRLILLICMLLSGCGQTGPLYLPEPESDQPQEPRDTETRPVPNS